MKKICLSLIVVAGLLQARAQFTYDYLRAADNYYKKADYFSAAQYYEKYLANDKKIVEKAAYNPYAAQKGAPKKKVPVSSKFQAIYNLAESYRQLNFPGKSVDYYKQLIEEEKGAFPLAGYHYAVALRALGQYEEAEKAFNAFLDEYKADDKYSEAARKEVLSLRFIQEQLKKKDLKLYTVIKAGPQLNTKGANYAPAWIGENLLQFTSTRADDSTAGKGHLNRVFIAAYNGSDFERVQKVSLPQGKEIHQGVTALTPDGNHLFLTRWTIHQGKKAAALYHSTKTGNSWSEPQMLDSSINAPGFNTQQPSVTPDGKYLLYASDKPGGHGGFDLWAAPLDEGGKTGASTNLGEVINTALDEQAPYYHAASGTLVFSGNGRVGMGGYDFYYSKGTVGQWNAPVNFGYPVNSVKDDIYFVSRGAARNILEDVFLSSDRAAECCLELFYLKKIKPLKQISGRIVSCDDNTPLAGATIRIIDTIRNTTVYSKTTGTDGSYSFTLEEFQPLKAVAANDGYHSGSLGFNAPTDEESDELKNPPLCLAKIVHEVNEVVVIDNVYYDFDKANLREDSYPALDKVVAMLNTNPTMVIEIGAHTDNKGKDRYNQKLSDARAASVVEYLVSKGIAKERLQSKGYGAAMPIAPNANEDGTDNPDGRQQNRRTEFKVISK